MFAYGTAYEFGHPLVCFLMNTIKINHGNSLNLEGVHTWSLVFPQYVHSELDGGCQHCTCPDAVIFPKSLCVRCFEILSIAPCFICWRRAPALLTGEIKSCWISGEVEISLGDHLIYDLVSWLSDIQADGWWRNIALVRGTLCKFP